MRTLALAIVAMMAIPASAQTESSKTESPKTTFHGRVVLVENESHRVKTTNKIRHVDGFDSKVIDVHAVAANELRVSALKIGTTKLTLLDENDDSHEYELIVETNTGELNRTLKKLFPHVRIEVVPIKGSVIVRGTADSSKQIDQIVEVCGVVYDNVLNHMEVEGLTSDKAPPVGKLRAKTQKPSTAESDADLRQQVRELHNDVKRLMLLLGERQKPAAEKDAPRKPKGESDQASGINKSNNGKGESTLLFFTADWCQPCRSIEPQIDAMVEAGKPIRKIETTKQPDLAKQYKIDRLPAFILLAGGKEVSRTFGAQAVGDIKLLMQELE